MTDRERYLKVASPDEWDRWLSYMADFYAPGNLYIRKFSYYSMIGGKCCWICLVFNANCRLCMGEAMACLYIPRNERIDRAIEKLEKARVFEE